jgi:branched-chain amino acid aminotransferase
MMNECFGRSFILNGELRSAEEFNNSLVYEGDSIYEVVRVVRGNPVFFRDHVERLAISAKAEGKEMLAGLPPLRKAIIALSRSDKQKEINLKIVFNYNHGSCNYLVYFIEAAYPTSGQYRNGVTGILFNAERKNPESKVINHKLRSSIYHRLIIEGAYEALLVNENNLITEGSRSNIFFAKDGILITAPDNLVLGGITRKYILDICREQNIKVDFRCLNTGEIGSCQSVFMTGTSPMVLPFNHISNIAFDTSLPLIKTLRDLYISKAEESIKGFIVE